MADDWKEIELNQRPVPLAANRVAVYTDPEAIYLRFLRVFGLKYSRLADATDVLELTNVAEILLPPHVAKRLILDLQNSVEVYERRLGAIMPPDELRVLWDDHRGQDD